MAVKIQKMRFKIFAIASPLQDDTVAEAQHRAAQTSTEQRRAVQDEIKKDEIQKIYPWGGAEIQDIPLGLRVGDCIWQIV